MTPAWSGVRSFVLHNLFEPVPRDHREPDSGFRRRRVVAVATLVVGSVLLGLSLATRPGQAAFYPLTAAVAITWVVGGFLSGPLHLGRLPWRGQLRRPVGTPIVVGLVTAAVFMAGAAVVDHIAPLRRVAVDVVAHAQEGNLPLVLAAALANGLAEEIFFRGALYAAVGRHRPVVVSTLLYAAATVATGNGLLVFAAIVMGTVFALQRRASGGILASTITHLTWSALMVLTLGPLLGLGFP